MNSQRIAAALRALAIAFETPEGVIEAELPPAVDPPKRPRGRPAKGEDVVAAEPKAEPSASPATYTAAPDPFVAAPATPAPTIEDVRTPALALSKATSQENAVKVMKDATGAASFGELKPEQYAAAIAAFNAALPQASDPFATAQSNAPDLAAVKAAVIAAQKRTGTDIVQGVMIAHGGVAVDPATGAKGPSLKSLPVSSYATVIEAIGRLPTTK